MTIQTGDVIKYKKQICYIEDGMQKAETTEHFYEVVAVGRDILTVKEIERPNETKTVYSIADLKHYSIYAE